MAQEIYENQRGVVLIDSDCQKHIFPIMKDQ